MPVERRDPRYTSNLNNSEPKARSKTPHPALEALLSRQQDGAEKPKPLSKLPEDYTGPALLKNSPHNIPIRVIKHLGYKDDADLRPHVSVMLVAEGREYRLEAPIPLDYVGIELSLARQWKADKKRRRRAERNRKNLSSKK